MKFHVKQSNLLNIFALDRTGASDCDLYGRPGGRAAGCQKHCVEPPVLSRPGLGQGRENLMPDYKRPRLGEAHLEQKDKTQERLRSFWIGSPERDGA